MKLLSLCLPTNGIIEWVFPVLDSIYNQNADESLFEVIVTDNGDNKKFNKMMTVYALKHKNLIYKKTTAYMFFNQLEALKLANGEFLKFINHRSPLVEGSLDYLIKTIEKYRTQKPVIYFSNQALEKPFYELNNFDSFVKTLRRFCSWTTGVGIWKDDYKAIPKDVKIDKISPHSFILFSERKKDLYIIDNKRFCQEIQTDHSKKGTYDLFKAFAVEELTIALNLYIDGDISAKTLKYIKQDYKKFVIELYYDFKIRKIPCSYKLDGFNDSMGIFYKKSEIIFGVSLKVIKNILYLPLRILKKIVKMILRKK